MYTGRVFLSLFFFLLFYASDMGYVKALISQLFGAEEITGYSFLEDKCFQCLASCRHWDWGFLLKDFD